MDDFGIHSLYALIRSNAWKSGKSKVDPHQPLLSKSKLYFCIPSISLFVTPMRNPWWYVILFSKLTYCTFTFHFYTPALGDLVGTGGIAGVFWASVWQIHCLGHEGRYSDTGDLRSADFQRGICTSLDGVQVKIQKKKNRNKKYKGTNNRYSISFDGFPSVKNVSHLDAFFNRQCPKYHTYPPHSEGGRLTEHHQSWINL